MSDPQLTAKDGLPPGYNMSWFCVHSMVPIPGGCKQCATMGEKALPLPKLKSTAAKPSKPPPPGAKAGSTRRPPPPGRSAPKLPADKSIPNDASMPDSAPTEAVDEQAVNPTPAAIIPPPRRKSASGKPGPPPIPATNRRLLSKEEQQAVKTMQESAVALDEDSTTEVVEAKSAAALDTGDTSDNNDDEDIPETKTSAAGSGKEPEAAVNVPSRPSRPPSVSAKSKPALLTKSKPKPGLPTKPPPAVKPPRPSPAAEPATATKPPRPAPAPAKPPRPAPAPDAKPGKPPRPAALEGGKPPRPASVGGVKPPRPASIGGVKPPRPAPVPKGARPPPSTRGKAKTPEPAEPPSLPARPGPGHPLYHYMVTGPKAVVLYEWQGDPDRGELSLKEGDLISLQRWVDPEWLEGEIAGKKGMFPAIFVDIEEPLEVTGPRVLAAFDFTAEAKHELTVGQGEEFELLGYIDEDWLRCCYRGQEGAIPFTFVEILEDLPGDRVYESWPEGWTPPEAQAPQEEGDPFDASQEIGLELPAGETPPAEGSIRLEDGEATGASLGNVAEELTPGAAGSHQGQADVAIEATVSVAAPKDATPAQAAAVEVEVAATVAAAPSGGSAGLPSAVVLYDWPGESEDDLALTQGQTIELLDKVDDDWYRGAFGMREGMFPASFVDVVVPLPDKQALAVTETAVVQEGEADSTSNPASIPATAVDPSDAPVPSAATTDHPGAAVAIYDYDSAEMSDLSFAAGEKLVLLEAVDADWFKGRKRNGLEGLFPRSFVQVELEPGLDPSTQPLVVMALYDYESSHDGDLPVQAGDEVEVLEQMEGWVRAKRQSDGAEGLIPLDYLEPL
eukprot:TRINITY_DN12449_c0_g1_i4.p1 TRINITY_DN12449_c0_g1~~TRINITY_DN12449_c0_g1_i4.p1  ORF type:complete len:844 (+),score=197.66 TRINITY_DN12449_c0_g1_i4:107-2638(+)